MFYRGNTRESKDCPEYGQITAMSERLKAVEQTLNELKKIAVMNAEHRVYSTGVEDGKRLTDGKLLRYINIVVIVLGTGLFILLLAVITYLTLGAEHALGFFKIVMKALGGG